MEPFLLQDSLHELHGNEVSLVRFRGGDDQIPARLWPADGIEEALAKVAGGKQGKEPKLVLPADAISPEFPDDIEHGQVHAELLPRRLLGEVLGLLLAPVELHPLRHDEAEGIVHSLGRYGLHAVKDPGLVHLVLGEANRVEEAASKVAVDHSHGSVAKHEGENAPLVDFL